MTLLRLRPIPAVLLVSGAKPGSFVDDEKRVFPDGSFGMPLRVLRNTDHRFELRKEAQEACLAKEFNDCITF